MIQFKERAFTMYDTTDSLKGMKDSDILSQKKKSNAGLVANTAVNTAVGIGAGSVIGGLTGAFRKGNTLKGGAKTGAIIGGLGAAALSMAKNSKQRKENNFYNDRLSYAQTQARRRERKDWINNQTNREGYTY